MSGGFVSYQIRNKIISSARKNLLVQEPISIKRTKTALQEKSTKTSMPKPYLNNVSVIHKKSEQQIHYL